MKDVKSFKEIWNKFMYMLTPAQKRWGIVVFILSLCGSIAETLGVSVVLPLVQVMIEPKQILKIGLISSLCDSFSISTDRGLIMLMVAFVIFVYIMKNAFLSFNLWIRTKFSMKVQREMSIRMIRSYNNRGYSFFRGMDFSEYNRGVSASAESINSSITLFFKLLAEVLTILCIFVYIAITDIAMVLALLLIASLCMILIIGFFRRRMQRAGKTSYEFSAVNSQWLVQLFYGIKEIMVLNRKEYFVKNYEESNIKVQKTGIELAVAQEIPAYIIEGICISGIMVAVGFRVCNMDNPVNYIPELAAFAVAAFRLLPSLGRISSSFNALIYQVPYINEAYDNMKNADEMDEEFSLIQADIRKKLEAEGIRIDKDYRFKDTLTVNDIRFMYPDGQEYVLDGVNIKITKGESVAFVGPSGAGKSTLADIVLGLLEPQEGSITIDGINIAYHKTMWSNLVGYVPQDPYLISDTVRRNVAFGLYDDEIDDDKLWRALEQAQMKRFIEELPEGLDTMVGERGVRFSGGQAQRLVIARALYNNPDILVLDEATSALDNDTEKAVMEAIDALQGQKTMIIIAHRLTTIKNCDHIYEIKDGKATEKKYEDIV